MGGLRFTYGLAPSGFIMGFRAIKGQWGRGSDGGRGKIFNLLVERSVFH